MAASSDEELVLLIHGTFAGAEDESGKKDDDADEEHWWREGGDVWKRLDQMLPDCVSPASREEEFRWSGDNSERDRREAGHDLYQRIKKLEKQGRKYHLVGHSHGGSVIWNCLLESVRERYRRSEGLGENEKPLPGLRSWTTVGTPFLQLKPSGMSGWFGLLTVSFAFWMSLGLILYLLWSFYEGVHGTTQWLMKIATTELTAWRNDVAAVDYICKVLEYEDTDAILSGLVMVIGVAAAMWVYFWLSAMRAEAVAVREEPRIRKQAFLDFNDRWLGLWSENDEAINGLRTTFDLGGKIAPRIEIEKGSVFDYERRLWIYLVVTRWLIAPFFNRLVSQPGDRLIWRGIARNLQGNDRPGSCVEKITTSPIELAQELNSLPSEIDEKLLAKSNGRIDEQASSLVRNLRGFLIQASWSAAGSLGVLNETQSNLSGGILIHTLYLHNNGLLELIRHHCNTCRNRSEKKAENEADQSSPHAEWYQSFRADVEAVADDKSLKSQALPELGKRNLLAWFSLLLTFATWAGLFYLALGSSDFELMQGLVLLGVSSAALLTGASAVRLWRRGTRGKWVARGAALCSLVAFAVTLSVVAILVLADEMF